MTGTMRIPFTGGCACGCVRYEGASAPLRMVNCHCRDCQMAGGGACSPTLVMDARALTVTKGHTRSFEKAADSGSFARRDFCPDCGAPLFSSSSGRPGYIGVRAASLDDPSWFKPDADVWVQSAQPWDCLDPKIPKYETTRQRSK